MVLVHHTRNIRVPLRLVYLKSVYQALNERESEILALCNLPHSQKELWVSALNVLIILLLLSLAIPDSRIQDVPQGK